jgi:hypothetical protein
MNPEKPPSPINSRWQNFLEHVHYRVDQVFARGSLAQFVLLGLLTVLVILFGMSAYLFGLFGERNKRVPGIGREIDQGFFDSLWWSMKHIFDPAFFDSNYGASGPVIAISLLVSVMGLVLFGALVGFISTGIQGRIEALKKGNSAVKESGHLLILGWNDKIYSVLNLLEDYHKKLTVVILSDHDIEEMQTLMRTSGIKLRRVTPILRTGSPNNIVELKRVAFESAHSIIVLADESGRHQHEAPDIRVIKTLMLLATHQDWHGARPKIVTEIIEKQHLQVAGIAADHKVSILCSSEIISKVIVQTSRQPGLSLVYGELFGFAGNEIYIQDFPTCIGRKFGELQACFNNAIPIGVSRLRRTETGSVCQPSINPGKDYLIQPGEWIICIARDNRIHFDPAAQPRAATVETTAGFTRQPLEQILILGWNEHLYNILHEFDQYLKPNTPLTVAAAYDEEQAMALYNQNIRRPLQNVRFSYRRIDHVTQAALSQLPVEQLDCVILLADDSSGEPDPDSRTILSLLLLRDLQRRLPKDRRIHVVSEILHARNCDLLQGERHFDFIVSPEMVSMLLTQISQQLMLKSIYEDLLHAGGNEIYLKPIRRYTNHPDRCTFADLMVAAVGKRELAIGIKIVRESEDRSRNFGVHINPPRDQTFTLEDEDRVIVLAQDLYDPV